MPFRTLLIVAVVALMSCTQREANPPQPAPEASANFSVSGDSFGAYWYRGLAEITTYDLRQARYGEIRPGTAVLIYVTEPFLVEEQVKANEADAEGAVTVLKLNAVRKFSTGVYPYSMMTSVFTPVEREGERGPLKVSSSSQEWCGHTYTQMNRAGDGYRARIFSYFEGESNTEIELPDVMLEDGLWTLLRLNPAALPTGDLRLVPGTMYRRLSHIELKPYAATAELAPDSADRDLGTYTITYPELERTLTIRFRTEFPHVIESWEDAYPAGFGPDAALMTTRAVMLEREMMAYWERNASADAPLRDSLGLAE